MSRYGNYKTELKKGIDELNHIAKTTDNHQMKRSIEEKLKRMSHDDKLICK